MECRAGEECADAADGRLDGCEAEVGGEGQLHVAERVPEGQGGSCGGDEVNDAPFMMV